MAEFDAFESAGQPPVLAPQEDDPAADFLAREQDQLAELGDDNLATATGAFDEAAPQTDMMGDVSLMTGNVASSAASGDDLLAAFDSPAMTSDNPAAAIDDVLSQFDAPPQSSDGMMMDDYNAMGTMGDSTEGQDVFSAIAQADQRMTEPEKIRLWRIEHEERLTKKDVEEVEKMEDWRQIARQELEDWYKHRDEQLDKTKVGNREGEAAFIKERDETLPGQAWEKICRLCEFNPKSNKSTKDNSRMRSILLQLKQTPLVR